MYYEINVAKNGEHFFATAERSITNESKAAEMTVEFMKKFPIEQGYEISVTMWQHMGKRLSISDLMLKASEVK